MINDVHSPNRSCSPAIRFDKHVDNFLVMLKLATFRMIMGSCPSHLKLKFAA